MGNILLASGDLGIVSSFQKKISIVLRGMHSLLTFAPSMPSSTTSHLWLLIKLAPNSSFESFALVFSLILLSMSYNSLVILLVIYAFLYLWMCFNKMLNLKK